MVSGRYCSPARQPAARPAGASRGRSGGQWRASSRTSWSSRARTSRPRLRSPLRNSAVCSAERTGTIDFRTSTGDRIMLSQDATRPIPLPAGLSMDFVPIGPDDEGKASVWRSTFSVCKVSPEGGKSYAVRLDSAFMCQYSDRAITYAAKKLEDDIPAEVKGRRLREVIDLQETHTRASHAARVGRRRRRAGRPRGRTERPARGPHGARRRALLGHGGSGVLGMSWLIQKAIEAHRCGLMARLK